MTTPTQQAALDARNVQVNDVYTVGGYDEHGNYVTETVSVPRGKVGVTKTKFSYVGPRYWCYYARTRARLYSFFRRITCR